MKREDIISCGWDSEKLHDLMQVLSKVYDANYELENCIRGCYTCCTTYEELSEFLVDLSRELRDAAKNVKYIKEDNDNEEND